MKWFSALSIVVLAVLVNACEKHPASALPPEHTAGGHHGEKGEAPHATHAAQTHAVAPQPEPAKPADEAKPGEAPKFFPEKK